jgi:hypothetical protein
MSFTPLAEVDPDADEEKESKRPMVLASCWREVSYSKVEGRYAKDESRGEWTIAFRQ